MIPNNKAQPGWTNPAAGVIATKPTIGPTHAPDTVTWPRIASITDHVTNPAAAAAIEFTKANAAIPLTKKKIIFFLN